MVKLPAQEGIRELSALYAEYGKVLQKATVPSGTIDIRELYYFFNPDTFRVEDYSSEILQEELGLLSNDLGLNFLSSYTRNYGTGLANENENFTRDRFQVELQWNLLSEGYRDGKIRQQIAENDLRIHFIEEQDELKRRAYGFQYNTLLYRFNQCKLSFLNATIPLLEQQEQAYYSLYLDHLLPFTEVLEVRKKLTKYKLFRDDYMSFNEVFENVYNDDIPAFRASELPVFRILIDKLIANGISLSRDSELVELQNRNLELTGRTRNDIKLRVFARRNYTSGALDNFQRNFNTLGVAVNVPLENLWAKRSNHLELQIKQNTKEIEFRQYHDRKELMNHYYEYEYKLYQYQQLTYEAKRLDELIRKDQLMEKDISTSINLIESFHLLKEHREVTFELISLKQQLYLLLLKIQSTADVDDMLIYLSATDLQNQKKLVGERVVSLTRSDVEALGTELIRAYLTNQEINSILVDSKEIQLIKQLSQDYKIITELPHEHLLVEPQDYDNKATMEAAINQSVIDSPDRVIVISNLEAMIELEMQTVKNSRQ